MNKAEFEKERSRVLSMCSVRPIQGVIRFSKTEGEWHFNAKCRVCYLLERGWYLTDWGELYPPNRNAFPKWFKPRWYTEVRFGKLRADVLVFQPNGTWVVEIADSEDDKSLDLKKRGYINMGIKTAVRGRFG